MAAIAFNNLLEHIGGKYVRAGRTYNISNNKPITRRLPRCPEGQCACHIRYAYALSACRFFSHRPSPTMMMICTCPQERTESLAGTGTFTFFVLLRLGLFVCPSLILQHFRFLRPIIAAISRSCRRMESAKSAMKALQTESSPDCT